MKYGKLKWIRFDGHGYVEDNNGQSYFFDDSVLRLFTSEPYKGMPVLFYTKNVLGLPCAIRIEEI